MSNKGTRTASKSQALEAFAKEVIKNSTIKNVAAENKIFRAQPPEEIVEKVKKGLMVPPSQCISGWKDLKLRQRLFDAGLLNAIVSFLNEGVDKNFSIDDKVLKGFSYCVAFEGETGELHATSPKLWLVALGRSIEEEHSLNEENCNELCVEIARELRPFVECMCDDITREIFKSKQHYHESLVIFFDLLKKMVLFSSDAAEVLLECDSLVDLVVQSLFWRTHRPDIIGELKSHSTLPNLEKIEICARCIIDLFIHFDGQEKIYDDQAKKVFKIVATTPIVSRAFDPDNDKIFISNVATLMKADGFNKLTESAQGFFYDTLLRSSHAGLIDKHVISSVIDLFPTVRRCDVASTLVETTFNLLCKRTGQWIDVGGKEKPLVEEDDERFAVAINNGMCESLLNMHSRFAVQKQDSELRDQVHNLLDSVQLVLFRKKKRSTKAIESNRGAIEDALQKYEQARRKDGRISQMVKRILLINRLDTCYQCFKYMEKKDVRRCSRCMIAKYCSKECQVEHWKKGNHKAFCNAAAKNAEDIKSKGGSDEDVHIQNSIMDIRMRGNEVYKKHSVSIVYQAVSKGYDILDCVVDVDLRVSPPTFEVMLSEDFLALDSNKETEMYVTKKTEIEAAREKKCLAFNYHGDLVGMVIPHDAPASSAVPGIYSLLGQTWPKLQDEVKDVRKMDGLNDLIETVPGFMDDLEKIIAECCFDLEDLGDGSTGVSVKKKPVSDEW